jgi:hypothetical protein
MICQNTIKAHLNSHQTHNSHTRSYRPRKLLWQDSRKIVSWILIKEWESDCFYVPKHCFVEVKNGACKWSLEKRWGLTPHTCLVHHLWWFQWRLYFPFLLAFVAIIDLWVYDYSFIFIHYIPDLCSPVG